MPLGGRFDTNDFMNQRDSLAQSFVLSGLVRDQGEVDFADLFVCLFVQNQTNKRNQHRWSLREVQDGLCQQLQDQNINR